MGAALCPLGDLVRLVRTESFMGGLRWIIFRVQRGHVDPRQRGFVLGIGLQNIGRAKGRKKKEFCYGICF